MDLQTINQLISMIKTSGLSAMELEENGLRIRLENNHVGLSGAAPAAETAIPASVVPAAVPSAVSIPTPAAEEKAAEDDFLYVKCPMVGIFCSLEKVGKKPLQPGDKVEADTVVCAVEAMKMVCDVPSEVSGVYVETLVKDGDQVEYGQSLIKLKKA